MMNFDSISEELDLVSGATAVVDFDFGEHVRVECVVRTDMEGPIGGFIVEGHVPAPQTAEAVAGLHPAIVAEVRYDSASGRAFAALPSGGSFTLVMHSEVELRWKTVQFEAEDGETVLLELDL